MKTFRSVSYPSQQQSWVSPGTTKLVFKGWIPEMDPTTGTRTIIDGFEIHCQLVVTVTTAALLAADAWRAISTLTIRQLDGTNRYNEVPGDALRLCNYAFNGAKRTPEQYNVATGATQTVTFSFFAPLSKACMADEYSTALPVEEFQELDLGMAQNSLWNLGTSVVSIASGTYWVVAKCHAEPKRRDNGLTSYAVDVVTVNDFASASQTQIQLSVSGKPQDMILYIPGGGGGSALTTADITQANIIEVYPQSQFIYPDLVKRYAHDRELAGSSFGTTNQSPIQIDPFLPDPADGSGANAATNPRAVALLLATGNRPWDGPTVNNLTINFIELAAPPSNPRLITRCMVPRNAGTDARQGKKNNRGKTRKMAAVDQSASGPPIAAGSADAAFAPAVLV